MKNIFYFIFLFSLAAYAQAKDQLDNQKFNIVTKEIEYQVAGTKLNGYLAYDASIENKRPGVLVVHEWWGHNEYARKRAKMLAKLGYVAFAVDMYGEGKLAEHPDDAAKFMKQVTSNMLIAEKRLSAALDVLHQQKLSDNSKTAAIGYCFGGAMVLHLARIGSDIDGVVSFHGSLGTQTPANKNAIKARVLVLHGEDDPFIPQEQVELFKQEMQNAGAKYEFIAYPNVKHSFTNPQADEFAKKFNLPALEYNQHADEDSWVRMQNFFELIFN
ncbi:MAG: dienelactone hydrolase family protein [Gammaproteobacteria bacterium]